MYGIIHHTLEKGTKMGLDMYLTARRYISSFDENDLVLKESIDKIILSPFGGSVKEVIVEVAYWRKANAIHGWFVTHCQNNIDECQETLVSRESLEKLYVICGQILDDNQLANQLLPPIAGFFFGSTTIDDYYLQDLEYTKNVLEKIISSDSKDWDFYYHSSW